MSATNDDAESLLPDPRTQVEALTAAKIRTFLFEVAEGVSNYRSLHSLTEQVEHQYHGRFLIELIQNAHDALYEEPTADQPARIAIVLDLQDSPHGTLLVANDGQPFTRSNFERLSALGQSDKDPQKSIGNKGLGFRSVLEVSERPEIYSRASATSTVFDGYCFGFEPEVVQDLKGPMEALAAGGGGTGLSSYRAADRGLGRGLAGQVSPPRPGRRSGLAGGGDPVSLTLPVARAPPPGTERCG